nr:hypothetical protein [Tanacetum cinerariifolium]
MFEEIATEVNGHTRQKMDDEDEYRDSPLPISSSSGVTVISRTSLLLIHYRLHIIESLSMKKTDEGVEDGYLGRLQEVNRSGGGHSVDVGGGGHGARSQRRRIRPMRKGEWMNKLAFGFWVLDVFCVVSLSMTTADNNKR